METNVVKIIDDQVNRIKEDKDLLPVNKVYKIEALEELRSIVSRVELPSSVAEPNPNCEQVRLNTIEECAKHLEELAEKANDVLVEERHILQEDTVELFRNDIDHARRLANSIRSLASKP